MLRVALKMLSALTILAIGIVGALVWRLWRGPIDLDFLTPHIEAAMHAADPDLSLDIGSTQLIWDTERWRPDFVAKDLTIANPAGGGVITLPLVSLRPRMRPLLEGRVQVDSVELLSPQLTLVRRADGSIGIGETAAPAAPEATALPAIPDPPPVANLGVRDGDIVVRDQVSGKEWKVRQVDASLQLRKGTAALEAELETDLQPLVGGKAAPARISLKGNLQPAAGELAIDEVAVRLDGIELRGHGSLTGIGSHALLRAEVSVPSVPTSAVGRYWPPDAAADARAWVTTNITGGAVRDVTLTITANSAASGGFELGEISGQGTLDGLSVRYVDTMTPATAISGTATLTSKGAQFDVKKAQVSSLQVSGAQVVIPIGGVPRISITATVAGDAAAAFAVLDQPPISLVKAIGLAPRSGGVSGNVRFAFPLRGGLGLRDLGLGVSAKLAKVDIDRVVGDWSLTAADVNVGLEGGKLNVAGNGLLQGVAVRFEHKQDLLSAGGRVLTAQAALDENGRRALGFDLGGWLGGRVNVDAVLTSSGSGDVVRAKADLAGAEIALPGALHKRSGAPGRATATVQVRQGQVVSIDGFEATYSGSSVGGHARRAGRDMWAISAQGDLAPGPGSPAGRATLEIKADHDFTLRSPDASALFASFGHDFGDGGKLEANGTIELESGVPFEAKVEVTNLQLRNAPVLARILTLASLRGAVGTLSGEGLRLQTVTALLAQAKGVVQVRDGGVRSQSFSMVARGTIDLGRATVDAKGSVIPSYFGVNEGVGKIPILGGLLTGGKEKAIQAIDFEATGPFADPKVKVNTLSSLTPRALSDLWHRLDRSIFTR